MPRDYEQKIQVFTHAIECAGAEFSAVNLLLSGLSERCVDKALYLEEKKMRNLEIDKDDIDKVVSFLFELRNIFHFVINSVDSDEHHLSEIVDEGIQNVKTGMLKRVS